MKTHTRRLLLFIPLLPLLMANSPAPARQEYKDIEVTYVSEETHYQYNFYRFNIKNTGDSYVESLYLTNKKDDGSFGAYVEQNEIQAPFNNVLIEPGFNKEVVVATKNKIPESKEVEPRAYVYNEVDTNITFNSVFEVSYSLVSSDVANGYYVYNIESSYEGNPGDYFYSAAIYLTYDGKSVCLHADDIDKLTFTTYEKLDLDKLTINEAVALRSVSNYRDYGWDIDLSGALKSFLIFFLIFFLLLGFGIFSAIFFPAMARRRRRRALQEQNNK